MDNGHVAASAEDKWISTTTAANLNFSLLSK